jgi:hypothetical protein
MATKLKVEHDALPSRMLAQTQPSPPLQRAADPRSAARVGVSRQTHRATSVSPSISLKCRNMAR